MLLSDCLTGNFSLYNHSTANSRYLYPIKESYELYTLSLLTQITIDLTPNFLTCPLCTSSFSQSSTG